MQYDLLEAMDLYFEARMDEVHTIFPGIVESYSSNTRLADVRPAVNFRMSNGVLIEPEVILDVVVCLPCSSNGGVLFDLKPKDQVLVYVSEEAIGEWRRLGQDKPVDSESCAKFSMADAFCVPCVWPDKKAPKPSGWKAGDVWFGSMGKGEITMSADGLVSIKNARSNLKAEIAALWDAVKTLNDNLSTAAVAVGAGGGGPLLNAAAFVQGSVQASSSKLKLDGFLK